MKKLLALLLMLNLNMYLTSCTSGDATDDSEVVENADVSKIESDGTEVTDSAQEVTDQKATADATADNAANTSSNGELSLDDAATEQAKTTPTDSNLQQDNSIATSTEQAPDLNVVDPTALAQETANPPAPDVAAQQPADANMVNEAPVNPVDTATVAQSSSTPQVEASQFDEPTKPVTKKSKKSHSSSHVAEAGAAAATTSMAATSSKPSKTVLDNSKFSDIAPYPFENGFVNTVYVARKKEKLSDISQTLFGSDKSKELKRINPVLKARQPKAGDKIFYVSPNRPTDSSKMMSYYEDNGMIPETYIAKKGDNLKKVSKELLGYDAAWKEVWASNTLDSKSSLNEGETFRYWRSAASVAPGANVVSNVNEIPGQNMAMNTPPPPTDLPPAPDQMHNELPPPPPAGDMNAQPPQPPVEATPPPPQDMAMNNPPPPPDMNAQPPQPPVEAAPPPPPPAAAKHAPAHDDAMAADEANPSDDMFTMLGIGIIVIGAVAYVLIKRKKKMAEEMAATTHDEISV